MLFSESISHCFSNYANFKGRASRSEFWWFNLFVLGLEFAANLWDAALGDTSGWGVAYVLVLLGTTIPVLAVGARRLHDLNKSGWLQLLAITIIGLIPLIIWWATASENNRSYSSKRKVKSNSKEIHIFDRVFEYNDYVNAYITQEDEIKPLAKSRGTTSKLLISRFEELIELCIKKTEVKLKYELETNVNLVSFVEGKIEIAFNENLDKEFIKELSNKLYEWTNIRWIIMLSKKKGLITKKQQEKINNNLIINNVKKSKMYNDILEFFPDAEMIKFNKKNESIDE